MALEEFWKDKKDCGRLLGTESTEASYIKLVSQTTLQTSVLESLRPGLEMAFWVLTLFMCNYAVSVDMCSRDYSRSVSSSCVMYTDGAITYLSVTLWQRTLLFPEAVKLPCPPELSAALLLVQSAALSPEMAFIRSYAEQGLIIVSRMSNSPFSCSQRPIVFKTFECLAIREREET